MKITELKAIFAGMKNNNHLEFALKSIKDEKINTDSFDVRSFLGYGCSDE